MLGLSVTTANNRRWSVAAQSIASGHGINSQAGSTPTTEGINLHSPCTDIVFKVVFSRLYVFGV